MERLFAFNWYGFLDLTFYLISLESYFGWRHIEAVQSLYLCIHSFLTESVDINREKTLHELKCQLMHIYLDSIHSSTFFMHTGTNFASLQYAFLLMESDYFGMKLYDISKEKFFLCK